MNEDKTVIYHSNKQYDKIVTILNTESLSEAIDLVRMDLVGIVMPPAWTAADIGIQSSLTIDGVYLPVYQEDGTRFTIDVAADRFININSSPILPVQFLKLESLNTGTGAPLVQLADRVLSLCLRITY